MPYAASAPETNDPLDNSSLPYGSACTLVVGGIRSNRLPPSFLSAFLTPRPESMKLILLLSSLALLALCTGCAGTRADTDFRTKVESTDTKLNGNYDAATGNSSGGIEEQIHFRDPRTPGVTTQP